MKYPIIPIIPTIIALICVIGMSLLGVWQLQRQTEKETRLAQLNERKQYKPYTLQDLNSKSDSIQDYPVTDKGQLITQRMFYIDNRISNGMVGYDVVVPFRTNEGLVLLNHGWVESLGTRDILPKVSLPPLTQFSGTISYPLSNKMITETNVELAKFPAVLQQIDLTIMQTAFEETLLPYVINLDEDKQSGFVRNWTPVVMAPEKHLGYAVQWFGLAIACLTIYLLSLMKLNQTAPE